VYAAPLILYTVVETATYADAVEAYQAESLWPLLLIVFLFWSLVTSYCGVRTLFQVSRWRARMWFMILPGILYGMLLGVVAAVFALLDPGSLQ
jgi:hypothetical protein